VSHILALAAGFAFGVAAERYRREWQASAWAYHVACGDGFHRGAATRWAPR
jgi:hypothetical protein